MGRLVAIDLGKKRSGIAVTDQLNLIASPLDFVETNRLWQFLREYLDKEEVAGFVVGLPKKPDNSDTDMTVPAKNFIKKLRKTFPGIPVHEQDERYTSRLALNAMIEGGMKKKDRRIKGNADKISATLILQAFLEKGN